MCGAQLSTTKIQRACIVLAKGQYVILFYMYNIQYTTCIILIRFPKGPYSIVWNVSCIGIHHWQL